MVTHLAALVHHCWYAGELDAGRRAAERLLSVPDLPEDTEKLARSNRTWYTPLLADLCPAAKHVRIDVAPAAKGWSTFNPAVIVHGGDLIGIVRSSNYVYMAGHYIPADDDEVIRTRNLLVRFDTDLRVVSQRWLQDPAYDKTDFAVDGLEDCRLRQTAAGLGVSATIRNAAPWADGRCRIATADLDVQSGRLTNLLVLDGVTTMTHEKNWMPILGRGGWLYACTHGGHVVTVDEHPELDGAWQVVRRAAAPPIAKRFRGGSQLVPWRGGWLACVHECADLDKARTYEHRLVWFDRDLRLRLLSPWFAFREQRCIEFCAGLAIVGDSVVMSYGHHDRDAWLCAIPQDEVAAVLYDPEESHGCARDQSGSAA